MEEVSKGKVIHKVGARKVVELTNGNIVKCDACIEEFQMLKVVNKLGIPSPIPISFEDGYLVMSRVEGEPLKKVWNTLSKEDLKTISNQLKKILEDLRKSKGSYIGFQGTVKDVRRSLRIGKACNNISEFNSFLREGLTTNKISPYKTFIAGLLEDKEYDIVLSHCDLSPRNIMIKDGKVSGLIDWECSGYYPEYWEFLKAIDSVPWNTGWPTMVQDIMKPYKNEYAIDRLIDKWY